MELFAIILLLILVVSLSGIAVKLFPFQIPLPMMQIILGAILAALNIYVEFDPELFLVLFIPPLLFDDGRKTALKDFLHNIREIVGLALVLVVLTIVVLGYLLYWILPNVSLPAALALAAVLSPTDAVALSGIVGKGRIEKNKMEIIEGEALMNDASGLVSLKFAILIATGAMEFDLFNISLSFMISALGGLAVGAMLTWAYIILLRKINSITNNDPAIQIVLLFLLPFASYLVAEHFLHASGILAAVSAGMTVRQSGLIRKAPLSTRLQSDSSWSMLTFLFNGLVFTLLGIQLPRIIENTYIENETDFTIEFWELCLIVLFVFIALMAMRFIWLWTMKQLPNIRVLSRRPLAFKSYTTKDLLISTFSGVRGAITLAGVLSIPITITGRYELVFIATGVILLSLITAIIILPILLKGTVILENAENENEALTAKGYMAEEAIVKLEKMQASLLQGTIDGLDTEIINEVSSRVIGSLRRRTGLKNLEEKALEAEDLENRMRLMAIGAERVTLYELKRKAQISYETFEHLSNDLDLYEKMLSNDNR